MEIGNQLFTLFFNSVLKSVDTIEGSPEEIIFIFNYMKDDKTSKITREKFTNLIGDLEKVKNIPDSLS